MSLAIPLLFLALVFFPLVYLFGSFSFYTTSKLTIPTLREKIPPLGDLGPALLFYRRTKTFHPYIEQIAAKKGNLFQFFFARTSIVVVSDLKEVEDILGRRHAEFDRAPTTLDIFKCWGEFGMLSLKTGPMWKRHIRLLGPSMTSRNLSLVTPEMGNIISQLLQLWELKSKIIGSLADEEVPGGCIDASEDLDFLTIDVISQVAFGASYGQLEETINFVEKSGASVSPTRSKPAKFPSKMSALAEASKLFFESVPAVGPATDKVHAIYSVLSPSYRAAKRTLYSFLDRQVEQSRARVLTGEAEQSLLDGVIAKEMGEATRLPVQELRDELVTFVIAGQETTSSTMKWILRYLSTSPSVQRRLREELHRVLPDLEHRTPSFEEMNLEETHYLNAVLAESLRLGSTVSAVYRQTLVPTTILGHIVPAKQQVLILNGYLGKSRGEGGWKTSEEDVASFRPERWLDEEGKFDSKAGPSYAFSLGQRSCFGQKLATLELKLFITQLSKFFLDSVPVELMNEKTFETITRRPEQSFVRLRRWEDL